MDRLFARAEQEAAAFASGGADGLLIENTLDRPWPAGRLDVTAIPALTLLADRVMAQTGLPVGISVLANDPETALSIAASTDAAFIRVPLLMGAMLTDSGFIEGGIGRLKDLQNRLKARRMVKIFADVSARHMIPGGRETSMLEHLARLGREIESVGMANALLVSDDELSADELREFVAGSGLPVMVFSSREADVEACFGSTDGVILGDYVRKEAGFSLDGNYPATVDMAAIEDVVSRLGAIKDVRQLDPDYFLDRMNS